MKKLVAQLKIYLAITSVGLGVIIFAYVAAQQTLRQTASELPEQIAQDTAAHLAAGTTPQEAVGSPLVDERASLSPFVTIVDLNHHVLASSGIAGNSSPLPPDGSFADFSGTVPVHAFTWQQGSGRRFAAVIAPFKLGDVSGYVLAAQSLQRPEQTIDNLTALLAVTALGVIVAPAIFLFLL